MRLTETEKREIRALRRQGWTTKQIAEWIGCSTRTVKRLSTTESIEHYRQRTRDYMRRWRAERSVSP